MIMAECSSHTKKLLGEEIGLAGSGLTIIIEEKELQQLCASEESSSCSLQECSMCGDVGLAQHLFKCLTCSHRYQHTYCSRAYPHNKNISPEASNICNWCLPSESCDIQNYKMETEILKPSPLQALGEDDQSLQVKKHTKAFEYLLQIAECHYIIPGVNNIEEKNNIQGHEEAAISKQNRLICNDLASPSNCMQKKSSANWGGNMAGKRQRNWNHNNKLDSNDIIVGEGRGALNRWTRQSTAKRDQLQLSSPARAINRRYKLLADVLC